jgi:hypothetical protein
MLMMYSQLSIGQDYLVPVTGDTLYGQVKLLPGFDKKIVFTGPDKKRTTFSMFQVKAYRHKEKDYHNVRTNEGYTYMKLIKPGYLSLYAYQGKDQASFETLFLSKKDGTSLEVPNLTFKKMMTRFLEGCSDVTTKIESGELNRSDLTEIIEVYNACIDKRTNAGNLSRSQDAEQQVKTDQWEELEAKINSLTEFDGKANALDMINDIKGKLSRNEKIPKFLVDGLKTTLAPVNVQPELAQAIETLPK